MYFNQFSFSFAIWFNHFWWKYFKYCLSHWIEKNQLQNKRSVRVRLQKDRQISKRKTYLMFFFVWPMQPFHSIESIYLIKWLRSRGRIHAIHSKFLNWENSKRIFFILLEKERVQTRANIWYLLFASARNIHHKYLQNWCIEFKYWLLFSQSLMNYFQ